MFKSTLNAGRKHRGKEGMKNRDLNKIWASR